MAFFKELVGDSGGSLLYNVLNPFLPDGSNVVLDDAGLQNSFGAPKFEHALEERGFIRFTYPEYMKEHNENIGKVTGVVAAPISTLSQFFGGPPIELKLPENNSITRKLPFFENPQITERRTANYANTNVFLRNEPVRLYTGSGPRRINLKLTYTLPHIAQFLGNYLNNPAILTPEESLDLQAIKRQVSELLKKQSGMGGGGIGPAPNPKYAGNGTVVSRSGKLVGLSETTIRTDGDNNPGDGPRMPSHRNVQLKGADNQFYFNAQVLFNEYHVELTHIIEYMLNVARSSVIGTVQSLEKFGPPVGRLNMGIVYNDMPVIVKDYRINFDYANGMDHASLFSRVITIDLTLEEFRQDKGLLHGPDNDTPLQGWDTLFKGIR